MNIVDEPQQIGPGEGLSAMLTRPRETDRSRPVFVLLNAGLLHRVGPFRLHVVLARRLARSGFPVLRIDLSGIGYTPKRPGPQRVDSARKDADIVFDWLRTSCGLERPVLLGSCSGADLAHRIAVADDRVKGAVFLDGYAYRNSRSTLSYYSARVHRPDMWRKWIDTRLRKGEDPDDPEAEDEEADFWDSEFPPLEQFRTELAGLLARDMPLLYVYTGSVREYTYEDQFFDVCPEARNGPVTVRYAPAADHTYRLERDRLRLLEAVATWATTAFPA
ncbi:MAG: alpha/beta fold hydrolase [Xanthomonadales bacterium]|nr:alpha/beta fold hydrolase [Xanthomonadales bacterium]